MLKSRYHPDNDPVLQMFTVFWATPLDTLIQNYLKGTTSDGLLEQRFAANLERDQKALKNWKYLLNQKKNETKEGLSSKELVILGLICSHFKEYTEALNYYRSAELRDDGAADRLLGMMYRYGRGVVKDNNIANAILKNGLQLGNGGCANNLAYAYEKGLGVQADISEAIKYYNQGAELNDDSSFNNLGVAYRFGQGLQVDPKQAIYYYEKSAKMGSATALVNLSFFYASKGGHANHARAAAYFRYAAEANYQSSHPRFLETLFNKDGVPEVGYHAAIILGLPEVLSDLATNQPEIFDELLHDDDWDKIRPLLKPDVVEKVLERNKEYFAQRQYLIEEKSSFPPGVSKLISSYTIADERLLIGVGERTQQIRKQENAKKAAKEASEEKRLKPLLEEWRKKRKKEIDDKEKERSKDTWLFAQPSLDIQRPTEETSKDKTHRHKK